MIKNPGTIDSFIAEETPEIQKVLKKMRAIIRKAAPKATEKLAWDMPTFVLEGNLVTFCSFKKHISLFPGAEALAHFKKDIAKYETSKATVQFPYGEELPATLITKIVKFCIKNNLAAAKAKAKPKSKKKIAKKKTAKKKTK